MSPIYVIPQVQTYLQIVQNVLSRVFSVREFKGHILCLVNMRPWIWDLYRVNLIGRSNQMFRLTMISLEMVRVAKWALLTKWVGVADPFLWLGPIMLIRSPKMGR